MSFGALGVALWALGALYQYLRGPSYGSSGIDLKDRITKHLLFELIITMPMALFIFAFPDAVLSLFVSLGIRLLSTVRAHAHAHTHKVYWMFLDI